MPISPKLLKHFAAATLAITGLIALLADDSAAEAVAEQVKANELKQAEVDMLGARRAAKSNLTVKPSADMVPVDSGGGGADSGYFSSPANVSDGPSGYRGGAIPTPLGNPADEPPPVQEGTTIVMQGGPVGADPRGMTDPRSNTPQRPAGAATRPPRPTKQQLDKLLQASRQRAQAAP